MHHRCVPQSANLPPAHAYAAYRYWWFSPQPLPVAWYEFFSVVVLTTLFSLFCNAHLSAPLTLLWIKATRGTWRLITAVAAASCGFCRRHGTGPNEREHGSYGALSAEAVVREAVLELTGGGGGGSGEQDDVVTLTSESKLSLDELGLASVGLPMLVGLLNSKDDRLGLKVSEVAALGSIGELVALIDARQRRAEQDTGVGSATLML